METNEKFILIKLNELPASKEKLMERASGNWAITPQALFNTTYALVTYRTEIVAVYRVRSIDESDEPWGKSNKKRLRFNFEETEDYKELKNRKIVTKGSNPASTILLNNIEFKN